MAAAGQAGAAGPSRSSGKRTPGQRPGRGASPRRRAARRARRRAARPRRRRRLECPGRPLAAPPPVPTAIAQPPIGCQTVFISRKAAIHSGRSARAVVEPVEARLGDASSGGAARRLMSSAASSSTSVRSSSGTPHVSSASTSSWAGEDRDELRLAPGQHVDDAARHVGRGEDLGQGHGRQRPASREAMSTTVLPATSGGASRLTSPSSDEVSGRDDADDAGRLGDREVEVRRGDRVGRAEDLGDLVGPAGVPDPAVDGAVDDGARARPRAAPRPPRPRRRTGRAGPPSARRRGRGPGRGSSPSWPAQPSNALRAARTASRRSLRDARQALASGVAVGAPRRGTSGPISVRGNAPPMYSL